MVVYTPEQRFAKWACNRLTEDADFGKKIIFSDEARFDLGGYVNKQNCRIWGTENPHAYIQGEANRYRAMLNLFLYTKLEEEDIGNIWFQQDSATCHTAEVTLDVLSTVLEDHIIRRRADVVWPPWSCYLTPWNNYLWGAIKDKCYAHKPETINA